MESLLAHLARKERGRLRMSRVEADESQELAEALGVTQIPTLVLIKDRKAIARLEGRASAPQIEKLVAPHLAPREREPAAA
jgi:thioredoxin-like negative regulator of GroEL